MSLRRPFRDSWEQRSYKRPARSLSPLVKKPIWTPIRRISPSPERSQAAGTTHRQGTTLPHGYVNPTVGDDTVYATAADHAKETELPARYAGPTREDDTDSDDDYPEKRALTPEPEPEPEAHHYTANHNDSDTELEELFGQPARPHQPPYVHSPSAEKVDHQRDTSSPPAAISPKTSHTTACFSKPASEPTTIYPSDSVSNVPSIATPSGFAADNISDSSTLSSTGSQLLRTPNFPVHLLRPVPDLITLLTQTAPVLGDPGTASVRFGNDTTPSPTNSIFAAWTVAKHQKWVGPYDPLKDSVLKEGPIDGIAKRYPWARDVRPYDPATWVPTGPRNRGATGSSTRSTLSTSASTPAPTANSTSSWKGRQYSTSPHLRTPNLHISLLPRAISHGELLSLDLSIDARRDAMLIGGTPGDIGGSLLVDTGRGVSRYGLAVDANASGSGTGGTRTRDAVRNASMSVASGYLGHAGSKKVARRAETEIAGTGWADDTEDKDGRYRAGDVDSVFGTGRYGVGGVCLWRLVRVSAEVGGEEHVAWWCVPERTLGGYF